MAQRRFTRWSLVAAVLLLLGGAGCSSGPERAPAPELSEAQLAELAAAEKLYRAADPDFDAERERLSQDPATAYWLARLFVFHLMRADEQRRASDASFLATVARIDDPTATRALEQLRTMGTAAAPALIQDLLRSEYSDRRQFGVVLLSEMGPSVLPLLESVFTDPAWRTRLMVVEIAARMETAPEVTAVLERGAQDPEFGVRAAALTAMVDHGGELVVTARQALTTDPDPYVRRVVAERLGGQADRATAESLVAYYEDCVSRLDRRGAEAAEASLQKISGHKRSGDLAFWRAWLSTYSDKEQR